MPSFLLCIGSAAERSLPIILTALSCGAAHPVASLRIFSLSRSQTGVTEAISLASDLSACHHLTAESGSSDLLFPSSFELDRCVPVFRPVRDLSGDSATSLLISALRGKNLPLSCQTDREAVEWCFADLLSRPDDTSIQPFLSWLASVQAASEKDPPARITLLADLTDPFSAGIALVLLPYLRKRMKDSVHLSLLSLSDTSMPLPDSFHASLASSLQAIDDRSLLRMSEDDPPAGADSMWLLSFPSSFSSDPDSFQIPALAAARIIGSIHSGTSLPGPGLHTRTIDGTLSFFSLRDQAASFAAFFECGLWLLSDILPSLRSFLSHPARLRSLTASSRNVVFRNLFSDRTDADFSADLALLENTLKALLANILHFVRAVPPSLRPNADTASLWDQAVRACGRYITVAAELDTSAAEARESGLDAVRPVHRVSMADTEEEQLVRRLEEIKTQLEEEARIREDAFSALGGYRSLQVRLDCLARCRSALEDARRKASDPADGLENLEILKRARRVRLLEAAVSRCESELSPDSVQQSVSAFSDSGKRSAGLYDGSVFPSEACLALEKLLVLADNETVQRLPSFFPDQPRNELKQRYKLLAASCRDISPSSPIAFLLSSALNLCREEAASFRFLSAGSMPPLPLLPDIIADSPFLRIRDVLSHMPFQAGPGMDTGEMRGLLAMLLLRLYRRRMPSDAALSVSCCFSGESPVLSYWLSSRRAEKVYILSLESGTESLPFVLILPGQVILPAWRLAAHSDLVPSFVTWFDPEEGRFSDPCMYLGEGDRKLLLELLSSYMNALDSSASSGLFSFISSFRQDLSSGNEPASADKTLYTRLKAVCGLLSLPAYESSLSKVTCFYEHFLPSDEIGVCLTGKETFPASVCADIPEEVLYLYRGIPFAREDSRILLDSPHAPGEEYTLSRLKAECFVLSESSDDYRDALMAGLHSLLERYPDALPEARASVLSVLKEAEQPVEKKEPSFIWPWDPKSPSMLTVLQESLGSGISAGALAPFSDYLTVFPARAGDIIGDALFSSMCVVSSQYENMPENPEASSDAVLPPLSPELGHALCTLPEGRTLLHPGFLRFERFRSDNEESDSFRVTLTLDGIFPVHFIRIYSPDFILRLYSHDIPTVALWPSVPFRKDDWHAYYVYAHIKPAYSVSVLAGSGGFHELSATSEDRCVSVLDTFPVCLSLSFEGKSAGILPNILPEPLLEPSDSVEICVDFGSSGTSVVFSSAHQRRPMHGPVMVRTLLNNPSASRDLLRREFIPAVPVSALLPTVSCIFRNAPGAAPVPFADGIVLMSASLEDLLSTPSDAIYTSLKWEEEKGRSGLLCLHQILLMAALQARFEGAPAVSWRFSLPDEMAKEGRESLMKLFLGLCKNVLLESGYPVPSERLPVSFASESSALGAYFRYCAPDDTRGGFMVLDLGACTADISLFMRGREQAVRTCQIPLGIHYIFLPSLLRDPELLFHDFSFCPDEAFIHDLSLLSRAFSAARSDAVSLRRARVAFDYFVADYLPLLISLAFQSSSAGRPTRSGSLLLLYLGYLLMLSGLILLQLAADPNKNDFLPEQMALCLSGRGATLLEALPPALKSSLCHFLSMFRNRRVASLSLLFSSEKKMEIPVGLSLLQDVHPMLPPASAVPASIAVRPAELLPEFLLRFSREFPASAEILFPDFFTNDYYHPFTDRGESLISASIDQSFPPSETPRPYDSLSAWIGNLLDLV